MEQVTVLIPKYLESWLRQEADRKETTMDELIAEAVYLYRSRPPRVFHMEGIGASGEGDLSRRVEEILAEEWGQHIDPYGQRSTSRTD